SADRSSGHDFSHESAATLKPYLNGTQLTARLAEQVPDERSRVQIGVVEGLAATLAGFLSFGDYMSAAGNMGKFDRRLASFISLENSMGSLPGAVMRKFGYRLAGAAIGRLRENGQCLLGRRKRRAGSCGRGLAALMCDVLGVHNQQKSHRMRQVTVLHEMLRRCVQENCGSCKEV